MSTSSRKFFLKNEECELFITCLDSRFYYAFHSDLNIRQRIFEVGMVYLNNLSNATPSQLVNENYSNLPDANEEIVSTKNECTYALVMCGVNSPANNLLCWNLYTLR